MGEPSDSAPPLTSKPAQAPHCSNHHTQFLGKVTSDFLLEKIWTRSHLFLLEKIKVSNI